VQRSVQALRGSGTGVVEDQLLLVSDFALEEIRPVAFEQARHEGQRVFLVTDEEAVRKRRLSAAKIQVALGDGERTEHALYDGLRLLFLEYLAVHVAAQRGENRFDDEFVGG
jgi:hypothetical protein